MKLFSLVIKLFNFSVITLDFPSEESKRVSIEMFKTENQCKTPYDVGAINGAHIERMFQIRLLHVLFD